MPLSLRQRLVARVIESSLKELTEGLLNWEIYRGKRPADYIQDTYTGSNAVTDNGGNADDTNLIGYSTIVIGGGGLGDLAIDMVYTDFRQIYNVVSVIIIVLLVQGIQYVGNRLASK